MIFIYNQAEKLGIQYKESKGKGSLNLNVNGENILIGSSKEAEIKNMMLNKASDKRSIINRLKRIFLSVPGKRLVLDVDMNEFKFIDTEKKGEKFNFAQNVIFLVCKGKVEVKTEEKNFVKAPEYTYLEKQDMTVIKLIPRWRAWYAMKEEVILDIIQNGKIINSFELGSIEDEKGIKSNSLKYRKVEPLNKDKEEKKPFKKPFTKKPKTTDKPQFTKKFVDKTESGNDPSRSKYPAKKKKDFKNKK